MTRQRVIKASLSVMALPFAGHVDKYNDLSSASGSAVQWAWSRWCLKAEESQAGDAPIEVSTATSTGSFDYN